MKDSSAKPKKSKKPFKEWLEEHKYGIAEKTFKVASVIGEIYALGSNASESSDVRDNDG